MIVDNYNIPNDDHKEFRFKKMIEYIANFPDEIGPIINDYFEENDTSNDNKVWWCLLYSASYCLGSSLVLLKELDYKTCTRNTLDDFWVKHKSRLIFQSDRRWIKQLDQFSELVEYFLNISNKDPYNYIKQFVTNDEEQTYRNLYSEISKWKYYGRFGIILFIFNLCKIFKDIKVESTDYDWQNGATTTSALFNVNYRDDLAQKFEDKKVSYILSSEEIQWLTKELIRTTEALKEYAPNRNWNIIYVSSDLCSYRKLYKGSRYQGFYIDRQLEEIRKLQKSYPEYQDEIWSFLLKERKKHLKPEFLGELNGWTGIRKQHSNRFLETGLVTPPEIQNFLDGF